MNIDDYRAMVAQEKAASTETQKATEQPQKQETKIEEVKTETKIEEKPIEKIVVDGVEVTIDELKNGYLRNSDYTKKTQEVAKQRKEAEEAIGLLKALRENPNVAQEVATKLPNTSQIDPSQAKINELEEKIYDLLLQQEISAMENKYKDFDAREVLTFAQKRGIMNIEDAYLLSKSTKTTSQENQQQVDIDAIKKQVRAELLQEMENDKAATRTIISSNADGTIVEDKTPKLSEAERNVAKKLRMSDAEYLKWKSKK